MLEGPDIRPEAMTVEALQAALERERERAREVDHRAKNSLQLVSSLLLLLGRRSSQPETQRALKAMHQRVGAVAAVHREILDAQESDRFNLTAFVREHVSTLARAQGGGAVVHLDLAPVEVSADRPAEVTVRLEPAGAGFALTLRDEGPGLPPNGGEGGFGLFMTRLLSQQLGADVAWTDAQPGQRVVVTVP
jgi:two-component sensor histidine kinase